MSVDSTSLLRLRRLACASRRLTALRRAITTGQLTPGTHLVETELSDALQISRGTLREAMRQLQQEGLDLGRRPRPAIGATPGRQGDPGHLQCPGRARIAERPRTRLATGPHGDRRHAACRGARDGPAGGGQPGGTGSKRTCASTARCAQLTGNETLVHQWTSLEGSIRMSIMFAGWTAPSRT